MSKNTWPEGYRHAMSQDEHEAWNALNCPGTRQFCWKCGDSTERCENAFILKPENPTCSEAEELSSLEGMRNRILKLRMYSPLVYAVFEIAENEKLNELDLMTILAFEALAENQKLKLKGK
jgi:hypothetical protein